MRLEAYYRYIRDDVGTDVGARRSSTAEMGAAFFCQIAALDTSQTLQKSTAYIQSWMKPSAE